MPPSTNIRSSTFNNMAQDREGINQVVLSSPIYKKSAEVATYIVKKHLGQKQTWNKTGEKMYELCVNMKLKHEPFFNSIGTRLDISRNTVKASTKSVLREVLLNGCNFGRIVSMYTFCMVICDYCYQNDELSDKLETVIYSTAEIMYEMREWFEQNNSWVSYYRSSL